MFMTDFSHTLPPHTCIASPTINIHHRSGKFVTIDEPILTHHYHLNVQLTERFTVGVHSMDFNKCVTYIHHYKSYRVSLLP